ncbi:MAG: VCBS repeat-containing protein [Candidatus Aegiribacteria sp.]|nr:VCBS repeat-containing protein [Candidatus Aegiribacteria sp.]
MDGYVGVYENTEGDLSNTMILVASETQWDPLDLALGDFNHDDVLDILVMCADRHPQILQGYYDNIGTYRINPNPVLLSFTPPSTGSIPPAFMRASIADVNGDNIADILVAVGCYLGELRSDGDSYSLSSISGKQPGIWMSCAYGPPVSSAPSDFTMLVGAAWDFGMGRVYEQTARGESGYIVDQGTNLIEYISDISAVYAEENDPGQYYLSLSECGLLGREPEDTRSRHCRVNCWDYSATGGGYSTVYFADPLQRPRKPEAFCTEWASIDISEQFEMTFSFSIEDANQRLFLISDIDGVGFENNFRVKLGITESEIQRGSQLIDAKVQYIENGLIYLTTPPQTGDVLSVTFLTTNEPCPVFGRRGVIELYEVFQ